MNNGYLRSLFEGRINRRNFCLGWAIFLLVDGCYFLIHRALPGQSALKGIVELALLIPTLIFVLSIYVRRLHDFGASGFLALLMFAPAINLLFTLYALFRAGDSGPNRFGGQPPETIRFPGELFMPPQSKVTPASL
jgi:uncharacterized membrane protein YhaH (DUF805 family)